jgi:hypothetical protein
MGEPPDAGDPTHTDHRFMGDSLAVTAGTVATIVFALSTLPMLGKDARTRDLKSYSRAQPRPGQRRARSGRGNARRERGRRAVRAVCVGVEPGAWALAAAAFGRRAHPGNEARPAPMDVRVGIRSANAAALNTPQDLRPRIV